MSNGAIAWAGFWTLIGLLAVVIAWRRGGSREAWEDAAFGLVSAIVGIGAMFVDWLTSYDRHRGHDDSEPPDLSAADPDPYDHEPR